jgi:AraC-like DNA-binding protein
MELAAEYLRNTDKSVKEIGYDLGYKEPPIFSRAFKKWFSMTPLEYREKHQS